MPRRPGPRLRRRRVAAELRAARKAAGLTTTELGARIGKRQGTVSKIENAEQTALPGVIRAIGAACNLPQCKIDELIELAADDESEAWLTTDYRDERSPWFNLPELEPYTVEIRMYNSELVPGLLQTPEYAEAVVRMWYPNLSDAEVHKVVDARIARQDVLFSQPTPPRLITVLNEPVILRAVGGEDVMARQRAKIVRAIQDGIAEAHLLLLSAGAHPGMKTSYSLLRFPQGWDDMDCVYLENENGDLWQERAEDIGRYTEVFARQRQMALSPEDTAKHLASLG